MKSTPPPELLQTVLNRRGKREGKEIRFCCPAHDDEHPSARYNPEKGAWFCDVCHASGGYMDLCQRLDVPLPRKRPLNSERTYDYHDKTGELLFQVVRKAGKDFPQRRPNGRGGWIWNLKGVKRVLYRLPEVLKAVKKGEVVLIVEGEKDADNVTDLGLTATTNPSGAGKWRKEYSASLRGARIAILPDNDSPGQNHAQKVAKELDDLAAKVRILNLPDLPEKGDVSDWIDGQRRTGRSTGEIRTELERLTADAPSWERYREDQPAVETDSDTQEEAKKSNQIQVLTEIASDAEAFHAPDGTAYATVEIDGHGETCPIRSKYFSEWLTRSFYQMEGKPPNSEPLSGVLRLVESWARWDGEELPVFVRVANADDGIGLDSGDSSWRAIKIDASGWKVQAEHTVKFDRGTRSRELPRPVEGGEVTDLGRFINVSSEQDLILIVSWLLGAIHPTGPYPILVLQGEQGSAKSTAARMLRSLIDPSKPLLRSNPRDERDLMIAASKNWVLAFDNLSRIPEWLSDAFCRLATGGGFATRELYTNGEEMVFESQRPIILNGIEDLAARQDLADRAIVVNLPPIPEEKRRTEKELWQDFEQATPRILGALYDAVSAALRNRSKVRLPGIPRMADFAVWVTAAEEAWPWPAGAFMDAYSSNRAEATELALENDVVASAVRQLVQDQATWEGTAADLLVELDQLASEQVRKSRAWPKSPRSISGKLRRAATFLRHAGIEVKFYRESGRNSKRLISIREVCVATVATVAETSGGQARRGSSSATQTAEDATQEIAEPSHPGVRKVNACDRCDGCDANLQGPQKRAGEQEVLWV